jgi:hypothetical protein
MKTKLGRRRGLRHVWFVPAIVGCLAWTGVASAADTNTPAATAPAAKPAAAAPDKGGVVIKKLSGVELYAMHCNRCHPERYPNEFTPDQWQTLMTHMRVRANLPADQARTIMKYLQEEAGN